MNQLKIALLCNNKMAAPAMELLARGNMLCGIATADNDKEIVHLYETRAAELKSPYCRAAHNGYTEQLAQWVRATGADVVFVMTFPWRLPVALLAMPPLGFLNFHYGLLPEMRGADPIFETIRRQKDKAGVTVHVMDEGFDTGPIVLREEAPVNPEMTYGMLASQLAYIGEQMCAKLTSPQSPLHGWRGGDGAALQIEKGGVTPQDEGKAQYYPKVGPEALAVHWHTMDSAAIKALVKSCNPVARGLPVTINGWKIGLCEVGEVNLQGDASAIKPGQIVAMDVQNGLIVYCCDGRGLRLEVVYTQEGYFPGYKLAFFGIGPGMMFV